MNALGSTNDIMVNFSRIQGHNGQSFQDVHCSKIKEHDKGGKSSEDLLMTLAENKYKTLLRLGEWKYPIKDHKEEEST